MEIAKAMLHLTIWMVRGQEEAGFQGPEEHLFILLQSNKSPVTEEQIIHMTIDQLYVGRCKKTNFASAYCSVYYDALDVHRYVHAV
jgi:hypothetical protein